MSVWISNKDAEGKVRMFMSNDTAVVPAAYFHDFSKSWKADAFATIEDAINDINDNTKDVSAMVLSLPFGLASRIDLSINDVDIVTVDQETLNVVLVMNPDCKNMHVKYGRYKGKLSNYIIDRLNTHYFKNFPCNIELHVIYFDDMTDEEIKLYSNKNTRKNFCKSRGFDENSTIITCATTLCDNIDAGNKLIYAIVDITQQFRCIMTEIVRLVGEENDKAE